MQTKICYKRANFDYTSIILQQNTGDTRSPIKNIDIHRSYSVKQKSCKKDTAQIVEKRLIPNMSGIVKFADTVFDVGNQVCLQKA